MQISLKQYNAVALGHFSREDDAAVLQIKQMGSLSLQTLRFQLEKVL